MQDLFALHRYYIWANRMRCYFDTALLAIHTDAAQETTLPVNDSDIFLSYWYSALFVVVEGWKELGLQDPEIDGLLTSPNVELLRRFRNGVCHYQKQYFDPRFWDLLAAQGMVPWVRQLNLALGRYFLDRLRNIKNES